MASHSATSAEDPAARITHKGTWSAVTSLMPFMTQMGPVSGRDVREGGKRSHCRPLAALCKLLGDGIVLHVASGLCPRVALHHVVSTPSKSPLPLRPVPRRRRWRVYGPSRPPVWWIGLCRFYLQAWIVGSLRMLPMGISHKIKKIGLKGEISRIKAVLIKANNPFKTLFVKGL